MNIIILGAGGFLGTNLTISMAKDLSNQITLVDKSVAYFKNIERFAYHNISIHISDLSIDSNYESMLSNQDVVYHLISSTVPATSNQHISQELTEDVILTTRLLDACVKCNVKKIVFISSGGAVYGNESDCPLKEKAATYPISSYGVQKVTIEKLLYLYKYLYGVDYRVVRLANPYGPYQRPNGVQGAVTTFTYKALKGEKLIVYGDGSTVRDYIYIDDAIRAIIKIANGDCKHRTFNIGVGYGTSIKSVLETIQDVLHVEMNIAYRLARKADVPVNYLDISRYERYYGSLNPIDLKSGIIKTVEFMQNEYKNLEIK